MTGPRRPDDPTTRQPMAQAPEPAHTGSAGDGNLATPMPLGLFLRGIAHIYDLAPRVIKRKPKVPKAGKARAERFSRPLGAALALSVVALFTVRLGSGETQGVLPSPLRGEWHTEHPDYRDRGFTIAASRLTFRIGLDRDSVTVHQIWRVAQTASGEDTTSFVVDYDVEGELVTWKFQYIRGGPTPIIRFDNQKDMIWTPVPSKAAQSR